MARKAPAGQVVVSRPTPRGDAALEGPRDVAIEMARNYRRVVRGQIDSQEGSRRCYMLYTLSRVFEGALLDQRIAALEAKYAERQANDSR